MTKAGQKNIRNVGGELPCFFSCLPHSFGRSYFRWSKYRACGFVSQTGAIEWVPLWRACRPPYRAMGIILDTGK